MEKNLKKNTYIFAVHLKLTQHCKSIIILKKMLEELSVIETKGITDIP